MVLRLPDSWSNWNLEMLVFEERGKPEYPEKNLSEQRREPTTNSTNIWRRRRDLNPGRTGGRRALSALRHPLLPRPLYGLKLYPESPGKAGKGWSHSFNYSPPAYASKSNYFVRGGDLQISFRNCGNVVYDHFMVTVPVQSSCKIT